MACNAERVLEGLGLVQWESRTGLINVRPYMSLGPICCSHSKCISLAMPSGIFSDTTECMIAAAQILPMKEEHEHWGQLCKHHTQVYVSYLLHLFHHKREEKAKCSGSRWLCNNANFPDSTGQYPYPSRCPVVYGMEGYRACGLPRNLQSLHNRGS